MKKLVLFCSVILLVQVASAKTIDYAKDGFPPLKQNNTYAGNNYNNLTLTQINQVEQYIFGETYSNQKLDKRLSNLEKTIFNRTYPHLSYEQRMSNIMVNYINYVNNSNFNDLSRMEQSLFKRNFKNDLAENRIARLETRIFGTIQSGNLNSRYIQLQKVIPNYTNKARYVTQNIPQNYSIRNNWSGSLGNFFGIGVPTGLSPQIYPHHINRIQPDFHRGVQTKHGWYQHNHSIGNGGGIRILD